MKIAFGISVILIVYYLGYFIGFKSGVRAFVEELNKMSKEFLDKTNELKKEVNKTKELEKELKKENNIIKECE